MDKDVIAQLPPGVQTPGRVSSSPREQLSQLYSSNASGDGEGLFGQLLNNPFFTAGFGLAGLGAGLTIARRSLTRGAALLRRRLLIDVEITRHDESYQWFLDWMSAYQRSQLTNSVTASEHGILDRILRKLTPGMHQLSMQTRQMNLPNGASHANFSLVPGPGRHILRYRSAFLQVRREREKMMDLSTGKPFETITLTTLYAHRMIFESLFLEAYALAQHAKEGKTMIYTSWGTEWKPFGQPKRKRPLESVVLAQGVKERLMSDVRDFIGAREWYLDRGIPYRRGYLLYGPPGTGKSSFIQALAGELDFNIAMLTLSERGLTDDRLNHLLTNVPPRTLVLLEDADAAFSNRTQMADDGYRGATVTFSGLLNALDGVASAEERIIFLTTNHVDRLDPALVRPGRVDMAVTLGAATKYQVDQMWDRFYARQDRDGLLKKTFLDRLQALDLLGDVSTAALQGLFLFNKEDPQAAIQMAEGLRTRQQDPSQSYSEAER